MKRPALALGVPMAALLCLAGCGEEPRGPVTIALGEDACAACRMIVSEAKYAAQTRLRDGRVEVFDDIGCLATRLAAGQDPAASWVADYTTGAWIDARTAHYLRSDTLQSPMAWGLAAFSRPADAEALAAKRGGRLLAFSDLKSLPPPR
ncbi:MAG: nitrous oxide reductase accessory protein NosL [Planctomycetes bacterium]|nr:nitrous oxide reductase accessory protein NosL [Planctomycetota bacterium]